MVPMSKGERPTRWKSRVQQLCGKKWILDNWFITSIPMYIKYNKKLNIYSTLHVYIYI